MSEGDLAKPVSGALGRFTRDLTRAARENRLEPVRCRDDEVARLIDILLRQSKNNAALVGPAGVGKTAIAEGLAQRLATGEMPLMLRQAKVLALDHVALLAGTAYRGQYEERIRALVAESSADPDVVLFIDELHNLIGQGTAMGVAMDAANMLKPALVRGDFRVIGATTSEEYERWICADPALERRFQRILVRELTSEETMDVLIARQARLEAHHHVVILADALRAAVTLTDEHITDRRRPDRAIDALDEACAHVQAVATYSLGLEGRIMAARRGAAKINASPSAAGEVLGPSLGSDTSPSGGDDFDPFAALERFGAELEAIIVGGPSNETDRPAVVTVTAPEPPRARVPAPLRDLLEAEGIIVRGVDVARVVAVATGQTVRWTE